MKHVKVLIACLVLLGAGLLAPAGSAAAKGYEGVDVAHARQHVRAAQRDLARAQARLRAARTILDATKCYTSTYGTSVGRWVWLSDDVGWPRSQWPTLFFVIDRESGGSEGIPNSAGSGALGLLQEMPDFYLWYHLPYFDRADARANLRAGYIAWRVDGWRPWGM